MTWHLVALSQNGLARVRMDGQSTWPLSVFVLLHGWTGDERVMEPFTRWLPPGMYVLLRAPYTLAEGGYGWLPRLPQGRRSHVRDYLPALEILAGWLEELEAHFPQGRWQGLHWIGFSQGACVAALFNLRHPHRLSTLASLVGFLPQGVEAWIQEDMWQHARVFAAWGTRDPIIPLERAQEMENHLRHTGAQLTVCYAEVGHKVGGSCREEFKAFYRGS